VLSVLVPRLLPQDMWEELQQPFQQAIDSFKLVPTTNAYIPPDQNPWLFF
jgi:hypothetical protein